MSNKLLLADDSITIRKVVGIIFANEDYILSVVDNGIAALEKAREIMPDIILADVQMPGKTGYEVCAEVRSEPALKHIPLLLLTGAFEPFDEEKARQSGADDFISKPFESQQLIEKVKGLIALGKERMISPPFQEPAGFVAPQLSAGQFTVSSPETPVPWEMGGVFPQVEEAAGEPFLQADQLSTVEEITEGPFLDADQLSTAEEVAEATPFLSDQPAEAEEIIEARPDDDLWDVFTLDEVAEDETADVEAVLEEGAGEAFKEDEIVSEFVISIEEETTPPVATLETTGEPSQVTADLFDHIGEELSTSEGDLPVAEPETGGVFEFTAEPEGQAAFVSGLADAPPVTAPIDPEFELQFAPEEEYIPVLPPVEPVAPPVPPPAAVAPTAPVTPALAVPGEPVLSDEQLASIVAKISREIIEKIAWEVVPDLAETLIREEIRKLKEGLRG
jgi:CheY-like chemotaxis protein